jgi:hypothetical protein
MSNRSTSQILSWARRCGASLGILLLLGFPFWLTAAQAQQRSPKAAPAGKRGTARTPESSPLPGARANVSRRSIVFTPEREAAALTFVRLNRPELLPVLEELKSRKLDEYERAICDYFWTSETLAAIRQDDPRRHELALRTWQLEAQTHLLASQLAGRPADADRIRSELQEVVKQLVDVQIETSAHDLRRLEAQHRRAQDRHKRLEGRRDELVGERMDAISRAIESQTTEPSGSPKGESR